MCEDWSHCLYRRSFKSVNWAILVQSEDCKRISPQRMMYYAKDSVQEYNSFYTVDRAQHHCSVAEAGLEIVRKVYTLVQKEDKHFLLPLERCTTYPRCHGECTINLDGNASEAEVIEEGESSNFI